MPLIHWKEATINSFKIVVSDKHSHTHVPILLFLTNFIFQLQLTYDIIILVSGV